MTFEIVTSPAQLGASLAGGLLIGAAASLYLLGARSIAGISGVFGRVLTLSPTPAQLWFLSGLLAAPWLAWLVGHTVAVPDLTQARWIKVVVSGLIVGYGTQLGSGCTSGHGVCGLANLSLRSLVAVLVFMAVAALVVGLGLGGLTGARP